MRSVGASGWIRPAWSASDAQGIADRIFRIVAAVLVTGMVIRPWIAEATMPEEVARTAESAGGDAQTRRPAGREILLAGYAGWPVYYRSDVHLHRTDEKTDLVLKRLGWDGDALYFPIDGGIRSVEWWGPFGFMIDFLHNKAIARLGKGAHGRKLSNPVVEEVEATGTLKGQPVAPRIKLTDVFERFEFTHGHNMLFFTPMLRPGSWTPRVSPYLGIGGGVALPHVEVWRPGENREDRTSEYQYAGPAAQLVAGLELRSGNFSYFLEYKFSWASIKGVITGDESWKNFWMPGDLWRQFMRWWRSEPPKHGSFSTRLSAHQLLGGAGYWWRPGRAPAAQ